MESLLTTLSGSDVLLEKWQHKARVFAHRFYHLVPVLFTWCRVVVVRSLGARTHSTGVVGSNPARVTIKILSAMKATPTS